MGCPEGNLHLGMSVFFRKEKTNFPLFLLLIYDALKSWRFISMRMNKSELMQVLGVSPPTLAAMIARFGEEFPVLERGGRGRDWWFDHEAVIEFLDRKKAAALEADTERQEALRQFTLPLGHNGGPSIEAEALIKPMDQLALWKVRRMRREEAYQCGRLVEAAKVQEALENLFRTWGQHLRATVRQFGRDQNLDERQISALNQALLDCQTKVVAYAGTLASPTASTEPTLF